MWLGLMLVTRFADPERRLRCSPSPSPPGAGHRRGAPVLGRRRHPDRERLEELASGLATPLLAHLALAISTEDSRPAAAPAHRLAMCSTSSCRSPRSSTDAPDPPRRRELQPADDPGHRVLRGLGDHPLAKHLAALWWVVEALRRPGLSDERRRHLRALLAMVLASTIGAHVIPPVIGESDPWIGVAPFITLAVVIAAYVVVSGGVFFASGVAGRAFRETLVLGAGAFLLVAALVALDEVAQAALHVDAPLFVALSRHCHRALRARDGVVDPAPAARALAAGRRQGRSCCAWSASRGSQPSPRTPACSQPLARG
ncbi:MAG: hypothetical protein U0838_01225 [Chloroflexota bacterium]